MIRKPLTILLSLAVLGCPLTTLAKKKSPPEVTHDGLHKVDKPKGADLAYVRPGVDFTVYNTIGLLEPHIAFRKDWKKDQNSTRPTSKISNRDIEKIIQSGKELFMKEFRKVLEEEGYPVVDVIAEDTLIVRPAIINLDIYAPDPRNENMMNKVYADGFGQATLYIELFDGPTQQILARAADHKDDHGNPMSWHINRTRSRNKADASAAMHDWAKALANGLERAKEQQLD
jgi:hypothetical protein